MNKDYLSSAKRSIEAIAQEDGVTVEYVRKQIKLSMLTGLCSSDPATQSMWSDIPRKDELPTPEEFIAYIAEISDDGN